MLCRYATASPVRLTTADSGELYGDAEADHQRNGNNGQPRQRTARSRLRQDHGNAGLFSAHQDARIAVLKNEHGRQSEI